MSKIVKRCSLLIAEKDLKLMQTAYGLLYELENSMRTFIRANMEDYYGIHWFHCAPRIVLKRPPSKSFESLLFSDYETYFRNYPKAFTNLPPKLFTLLHQLYPIRNKIAHNHLLSLSEFELLEQYCSCLIKFMDNKHRKSLVMS